MDLYFTTSFSPGKIDSDRETIMNGTVLIINKTNATFNVTGTDYFAGCYRRDSNEVKPEGVHSIRSARGRGIEIANESFVKMATLIDGDLTVFKAGFNFTIDKKGSVTITDE